jgi:hypothetical protein
MPDLFNFSYANKIAYYINSTWFTQWKIAKGQLISEWNFVFKSPKKTNLILDRFCPMTLGQKFVRNLVGFLGDLKTPKFHSEIIWPLISDL